MAVTYATWNPADKHADLTLSGGNLTMTTSVGAWRWARATIWVSSGKWYWEITNTTTLNPYWSRGIAKTGATLADHVWFDANWWGWYNDWSSTLKFNNNTHSSYWALSSSGDVIGFALDMDAGTLICYKNNVSQWTIYSSLSWTFYPMCCVNSSSPTITANFWATTMAYTAPAWYNQWLYTWTPDNSNFFMFF